MAATTALSTDQYEEAQSKVAHNERTLSYMEVYSSTRSANTFPLNRPTSAFSDTGDDHQHAPPITGNRSAAAAPGGTGYIQGDSPRRPATTQENSRGQPGASLWSDMLNVYEKQQRESHAPHVPIRVDVTPQRDPSPASRHSKHVSSPGLGSGESFALYRQQQLQQQDEYQRQQLRQFMILPPQQPSGYGHEEEELPQAFGSRRVTMPLWESAIRRQQQQQLPIAQYPWGNYRQSEAVRTPAGEEENDRPLSSAAMSAPAAWKRSSGGHIIRPRPVDERPELEGESQSLPATASPVAGRSKTTGKGLMKKTLQRLSVCKYRLTSTLSNELIAYNIATELTAAFTAYSTLFCITLLTAGSAVPSLMMWPGLIVAFAALWDNHGYLLVLSSAMTGLYLAVTAVALMFPIQGFEYHIDLPLLRSLLLWGFMPLGLIFCIGMLIVGSVDPFVKLGSDFPWTPLQQQEKRRRNFQAASSMFTVVMCILNACPGCIGGVFFCICAILGCLAGRCASRAEAFLFAALSLVLDCTVALASLATPVAGFEVFIGDGYLRHLLYFYTPLSVLNLSAAVWFSGCLDLESTKLYCCRRRATTPEDAMLARYVR